jgi:hypothetical protein
MSSSVLPTTQLDTQVQNIKARISGAQRDAARAELAHTTAVAELTAATQSLTAEFGVSTMPAAYALLADLESQLQDQLTSIAGELDALQVDTAPPAT